MHASYTHCHGGRYFFPCIIHSDGRREVLPDFPHATIKTALKYARAHIADRLAKR
jgi:hypothetical protein